jgi:RNA polymerase subunit RPABC4/transcription elongation factor Spt4
MNVESVIARTIQAILALGGAYLVALWFVLIVWTYRDIEARSRNVLTQVFSTLLVVLFWVPGALLYLILRPKESLDTAYQRSLEEEYLLQDLEELPVCPSCERYVEDDFLLCPHCHTRLREACLACARLIDLRWSVCPYCAAPQGGETAGKPERVEAPAARWRASTRRRRATPAIDEVAATVAVEVGDVPESTVAAVAAESTNEADEPATPHEDAPVRPPLREPIPLVPTPKGRFRRQGSDDQHARPTRPTNGASNDQVPVGGLFTSILGSRNGHASRDKTSDDQVRRRPTAAESGSPVGEVAARAGDGRDEVVAASDSRNAPDHGDPDSVALPIADDQSQLVGVRAEGKGD